MSCALTKGRNEISCYDNIGGVKSVYIMKYVDYPYTLIQGVRGVEVTSFPLTTLYKYETQTADFSQSISNDENGVNYEQTLTFTLTKQDNLTTQELDRAQRIDLRYVVEFNDGTYRFGGVYNGAKIESIKYNKKAIKFKVPNLGNLNNKTIAYYLLDKINQGYNDFYFRNNDNSKSKEVNNILETADIKFSLNNERNKYADNLSQGLNQIIQDNKGLDEASNDIVVFCHDDIILKNGWDTKIINHFDNTDYGILGMAGTTDIDESGQWWKDSTKMVGIVKHSSDGKTWESKYSNNFGSEIIETVMLDGLLFAVRKDRIKKRFNEDIKGFHFYDFDFTFGNHLEGVKVGVMFDVKITHKSVGATNKEWDKNRLQFCNLYADHLPYNLPVELRYDNTESKWPKKLPGVGVIIPTKGNIDLLTQCVNSIIEKDDYPNIEILIADTGSEEDEINQIKELIEYSENIQIKFFASVWDLDSVKLMSKYTKIAKIPSALINDLELCKATREAFDTLIISTGMSTQKEIDNCIQICHPDVIMHTNSTYPCPSSELNLNYIHYLQEKYGQNAEIGYSGHEFGLVTTYAAVAMGSRWVERHITLDRHHWGSDQSSSIEPDGLIKLVKGIRSIEQATQYPSGERLLFEGELLKRDSLRKN